MWTSSVTLKLCCILGWYAGSVAAYHPENVLHAKDTPTELLTPLFFPEYNSERVKIYYGTHSVPGADEHGGMQKVKSMLPLPCSDCLVTWMQAGLEYPNGTVANADNGLWLHHTVFSMYNKPNAVCKNKGGGDRFFASGNERTPFDLTANGERKTGYYISPDDRMGMVVDLMNMNMIPKDVLLWVTWEYIPSAPEDFDQIVPYWLDVGGCGSSGKPGQTHGKFHYSSPIRTSHVTGQVVTIAGHLHDGGTHVEVLKNGNVICTSEASYQGRHIVEMSDCQTAEGLSPGDEWFITAYYDTSKYQPMASHNGHLEPVMGIALAYVVENEVHPHEHHDHRILKILGGAAAVGLVILAVGFWMKRRSKSLWDFVPEQIRSRIVYKRVNNDSTYDTTSLLTTWEEEEGRYHDE